MEDAAPSSNIQSVTRALGLLEALNRRAWSTVDQLHKDVGLPKSTVVRMLQTLVHGGYVARDMRQNGYRVTGRVQSLACGFHGDPLVVAVVRPWAIALTRDFRWPAGVAVLDNGGVTIRFSTIPDSPISPFHASLNMRLSLFSNALGLAYYAFCPDEEQALLKSMISEEDRQLLAAREAGWLDWRVRTAREDGYARRDPRTEPRNSDTMAVPIMNGDRVAATIGITYFKRAVTGADRQRYFDALRRTAHAVEDQIRSLAAMRPDPAPDGPEKT